MDKRGIEMGMDRALWRAVVLAIGFGSVGGWMATADVVDFSHLVDELIAEASVAAAVEEPVEEQGSAIHRVDPVLQERVMELDRLVEVRDRQIESLKQALEEVTSEFSSRVAELRAQRGADETGAVAELRSELEATETKLASLQQDHDALQRAKDTTLEDMVGAQQAKEAALTAQEAELQAAHETAVAKIQAVHRAEQAALQADFDAFRAESANDREAASKLRGEVLRLEAALRVAQAENKRERFLLAYNSGSLFLAAGRYDRAEREFLKALAVREDDAPLHYNMGILYGEHLDQSAKARRHYERFLELAPNDRDAPRVMQWLRELR